MGLLIIAFFFSIGAIILFYGFMSMDGGTFPPYVIISSFFIPISIPLAVVLSVITKSRWCFILPVIATIVAITVFRVYMHNETQKLYEVPGNINGGSFHEVTY
jgi:hypothetical protein